MPIIVSFKSKTYLHNTDNKDAAHVTMWHVAHYEPKTLSRVYPQLDKLYNGAGAEE